MSFRGQTFFYCPKRSNNLSPSPKSRHIISHHSLQTYSIHTKSKQTPRQTTIRIQNRKHKPPKDKQTLHHSSRTTIPQPLLKTITTKSKIHRDDFIKRSGPFPKSLNKNNKKRQPHRAVRIKKRAGINPALFKYSMFIKPLLR